MMTVGLWTLAVAALSSIALGVERVLTVRIAIRDAPPDQRAEILRALAPCLRRRGTSGPPPIPKMPG